MESLRGRVLPLSTARDAYDPLLDRIGHARFVLLGEASHGTHEFYRERARITRRLIHECGFTAVAVEADWPDAGRVNRYVQGQSRDRDAREALSDFGRFPGWMWRNTEVTEFVSWLRSYNDARSRVRKVGFYGLDLYSLRASMQAVLEYVEKVDPEIAARVRARYACFDHFDGDPHAYGLLLGSGVEESCEDDAAKVLLELRRRSADFRARDGRQAEDDLFYAEQNARLVKSAEAYYRLMFLEEASTWNLRDRHMAETLQALAGHLESHGETARIVVWAHNSHLGDARATAMHERGELNLGQLVRERHGTQACLVGFTTHGGTVTAASDWGGPAERKIVRPALPGSYEAQFHETGIPRFMVDFSARDSLTDGLREPALERAIGVIYRPQTERASHYFSARLSRQFDAVLHFDETRAVEPLERTSLWEAGEVPETYPFGV